MEIDKKQLEAYIASHCRYYKKSGECMHECTRDKLSRCHLDDWTKSQICVPDCPHFADIPLRECNFGRCSYVKKELKKLA